jgi:hypothetical protein
MCIAYRSAVKRRVCGAYVVEGMCGMRGTSTLINRRRMMLMTDVDEKSGRGEGRV